MRQNKRKVFDEDDPNMSENNNNTGFNPNYNEEFINGVNTNQYYGMIDPRFRRNMYESTQNLNTYPAWSQQYVFDPYQRADYYNSNFNNSMMSDLSTSKEKVNSRKKIKLEYISGKNKRNVTFSKRKKGIMKKAYELSVLTGSEILLLVASESGHVYTYATQKLKPIIRDHEHIIQKCLSNNKNFKDEAILNSETDSDE
ncbi:hypothetical protein P3W45_000696 [Vairimorpha bombi]|jgi:hypothetical protein